MTPIRIMVIITLLCYAVFCRLYADLDTMFNLTIVALGFCMGYWAGENYKLDNKSQNNSDED